VSPRSTRDAGVPLGCAVPGWAILGVGLTALVAGGIGISSCDVDLSGLRFGVDACGRSTTPLVQAAVDGDLDRVRDELDDGVDPDQRSRGNATALRCAAERGETDAVEALLQAGADPDLRDVSGDTALLWAAQNDHLAVVEALLAAGADPQVATDEGHRPLLRAAYEGHADIIRAMVAGGADLDAAARLRPTNAPAGADPFGCLFVDDQDPGPPRTTTVDPHSAGFDDCQRRNDRAYPRLPPGPAEDVPALFAAAYGGQAGAAEALLDLGADVDPVAFDAYTPLYIAAATGHADVVELLVDAGADPRRRSPLSGLTPAEAAFALGNREVAETLRSA
jgi:cytohesin